MNSNAASARDPWPDPVRDPGERRSTVVPLRRSLSASGTKPLQECGLEAPARTRQPRHDSTDRNVGDFGDFLVGEAFNVAQHNHLAKLLWQLVERRAQRLRIRLADELEVCGRGFVRVLLFIEAGGRIAGPVAAHPGKGRVAHDREQPRARITTAKTLRKAQRAQIGFLDNVLRVGFVLHQPAREVVGGVQMRQEDALKILPIVNDWQLVPARRRRLPGTTPPRYEPQARFCSSPHFRTGQPRPRSYTGGFDDSNRADRKSTRLNSSHVESSYAVFCLKKKNKQSRSSTRDVTTRREKKTLT